MATFGNIDKYDAAKGYAYVLWGDRSKVLDVELTEMQKIMLNHVDELGQILFTNGFLLKSTMTYSGGVLTVPTDSIMLNGRRINIIDSMTLTVGASNTVYLAIWDQQIVYTDSIKRSGNQSGGGALADNGIFNATIGIETSRRYQTQVQLTTSNADGTKTYLPVASISAGSVMTDNRVQSTWANANFSGVPTAPTAAADTNTTQLATTAFVRGQASITTPVMDGVAAIGTSARFAKADHVHASDTSRAATASPTFTGVPVAPTAVTGTNTTQIATTQFVQQEIANDLATVSPLMDGTAAVGTSTQLARQDHVHPTDTTRAPAASPTFTGTPVAPTANVDTNTTQLATTAFVIAQAASVAPLMDGAAAIGTSTRFARQDHVHASDTSRAPAASPTFTGVPVAPTATVDTNTTQLATTQFVLAQAASTNPVMDGAAAVGTSTRFARADHVHASDTSRAPAASPTFTGVPVAPTATVDTNTTQLATTQFVLAQASATTPAANGTAAVGVSTRFARADHVHANDTTKANTASPTFTGIPVAPTATVDTNTTQLATTQFVLAQASGTMPAANGTAAIGTSTRFARADHVHASDTTKADKVSPTFTGTPVAPTATAGTNTTQIATTQFVKSAIDTSATGIYTTLGADTGAQFIGIMDGGGAPSTLDQELVIIRGQIAVKAALDSPTFEGNPKAPTPTAGDNDTSIATTAFVKTAIDNMGVVSRNEVSNYLMNTTAEFTVASGAVAVTTNAMIMVYLRVITGTTNVTVKLTYADSGGAQTLLITNAQPIAVGSYSLLPVMVQAVAGTPLSLLVTTSVANRVYVSATIMGV